MSHPSIPKPAIAEGIVEIQFIKSSFDSGFFGELSTRLGPEFPRMAPEPVATIQSSGLETLMKQGLRARYPHAGGSHLLQLTSSSLSVHALAPYRGWAAFVSQVEFAWSATMDVVDPASVRRLGLRYVSRIPWQPGELLSDWIAASELVPQGLLRQRELFLQRFAYAPEAGSRVQLTIADAQFPGQSVRHLVLDVDVALEAGMGTAWSALGPEVELLHERVWDVLSISCVPRLLECLKEGTS